MASDILEKKEQLLKLLSNDKFNSELLSLSNRVIKSLNLIVEFGGDELLSRFLDFHVRFCHFLLSDYLQHLYATLSRIYENHVKVVFDEETKMVSYNITPLFEKFDDIIGVSGIIGIEAIPLSGKTSLIPFFWCLTMLLKKETASYNIICVRYCSQEVVCYFKECLDGIAQVYFSPDSFLANKFGGSGLPVFLVTNHASGLDVLCRIPNHALDTVSIIIDDCNGNSFNIEAIVKFFIGNNMKNIIILSSSIDLKIRKLLGESFIIYEMSYIKLNVVQKYTRMKNFEGVIDLVFEKFKSIVGKASGNIIVYIDENLHEAFLEKIFTEITEVNLYYEGKEREVISCTKEFAVTLFSAGKYRPLNEHVDFKRVIISSISTYHVPGVQYVIDSSCEYILCFESSTLSVDLLLTQICEADRLERISRVSVEGGCYYGFRFPEETLIKIPPVQKLDLYKRINILQSSNIDYKKYINEHLCNYILQYIPDLNILKIQQMISPIYVDPLFEACNSYYLFIIRASIVVLIDSPYFLFKGHSQFFDFNNFSSLIPFVNLLIQNMEGPRPRSFFSLRCLSKRKFKDLYNRFYKLIRQTNIVDFLDDICEPNVEMVIEEFDNLKNNISKFKRDFFEDRIASFICVSGNYLIYRLNSTQEIIKVQWFWFGLAPPDSAYLFGIIREYDVNYASIYHSASGKLVRSKVVSIEKYDKIALIALELLLQPYLDLFYLIDSRVFTICDSSLQYLPKFYDSELLFEKYLSYLENLVVDSYVIRSSNGKLIEFVGDKVKYFDNNIKSYIFDIKSINCFLESNDAYSIVLFSLNYNSYEIVLSEKVFIPGKLVPAICSSKVNKELHEVNFSVCEDQINIYSQFNSSFVPIYNKYAELFMDITFTSNIKEILKTFSINTKKDVNSLHIELPISFDISELNYTDIKPVYYIYNVRFENIEEAKIFYNQKTLVYSESLLYPSKKSVYMNALITIFENNHKKDSLERIRKEFDFIIPPPSFNIIFLKHYTEKFKDLRVEYSSLKDLSFKSIFSQLSNEYQTKNLPFKDNIPAGSLYLTFIDDIKYSDVVRNLLKSEIEKIENDER